MTPTRPPGLVPGSAVRVVATAGPANPEALAAGISVLKDRFEVRCAVQSMETAGFLAGSDAARLSDLGAAIDDGSCGAIVATRGGYGTTRILERLNLQALAANPRWLVGSSDLTALLVKVWSEYGLQSIHGPMAARLLETDPRDLEALVGLLSGETWSCPEGLQPLYDGAARGPMVGGNLTMLAHLCGTIPPEFARGAILFIEDIAEHPYRLDRCLVQLRRAGVFKEIAGVVTGEFTGCHPAADGVTSTQVIADNFAPLGIPVAMSYPAAHGDRNAPFIHGGWLELKVEDKLATLKVCDPT